MPFKDTRVLKKYKHEWYLRKKKGLPTRTKPILSDADKAKRRLETKRRTNEKVRARKSSILKERLGDKCYFCLYEKRLTCHRKDGKAHKQFCSMSLGAFKNELDKNADKYVRVCFKCHKAIHWCMDKLKLDWREIERRFPK
ncbi:MAG: hypothetical protein V1818_03820 [Candidatus Aenigmatarchaeota archaeon]